MSKVKISYNRETKLVPAGSKTYDEMIKFIKFMSFKDLQNMESIKLYYQDSEGDFVSVANEDEFNDAM